MAMTPYAQGGLPYALLYDGQVSACPFACFSAQNQYHILQYLTVLAARQYTGATSTPSSRALPALRRQVPGSTSVLTKDLTQTICADISVFITAAQASGLAPSTINTKVGLLAGFFDYLREEGQMTQQPVLRRRHRLLTPTVLPKPIPDTDLVAFFQVIDSVRDRLMFLFMLRCGLRVSEVCALAWDAIDADAGTVRINGARAGGSRGISLL